MKKVISTLCSAVLGVSLPVLAEERRDSSSKSDIEHPKITQLPCHQVVQGDTFESIAWLYTGNRRNSRELMILNGFKLSDELKPGTFLYVFLGPGYYKGLEFCELYKFTIHTDPKFSK